MIPVEALKDQFAALKAKTRTAIEELKESARPEIFAAAKRLQALQEAFEQIMQLLPMASGCDKDEALRDVRSWMSDNYSFLSTELFLALLRAFPALAAEPGSEPSFEASQDLRALIACLLQEAHSLADRHFLSLRRSGQNC